MRKHGGVHAARIRQVELLRVAMVLRAPVVTAYGTEHERDVVLVHVLTDDGDGWGECAALTEPTYGAEYVAGALHVLEHHLVPRLLAAAAHEDEAARLLSPVVGHPMAKAAIEMALLDARLRHSSLSMAAELGATATAVTAGRTVGIQRDVGALRAEVAEAVTHGYRHLKLKIAPGWDREPLAAIRHDHPHVSLGADANGSYDPDDAAGRDALDALDDLGLSVIEQPLPIERGDAHARLAARLRTPVALDEDVTSAAVGGALLARAEADAIVVKPGRLGGLHAALALGRTAHGRAWVGGRYETGLGRAANLVLAACADAFTLPVDWSASDRYWDTDLTAPHVLRADGTIAVPAGPGLGVSPDPATLAARVRERRVLTA